MAAEFTAPKTSTVSMNVGVDADGNIAQSGETAVGTKNISIQGIKTDANLAGANKVFGAFIGNIAKGTYDSLSATKVVTYTVAE